MGPPAAQIVRIHLEAERLNFCEGEMFQVGDVRHSEHRPEQFVERHTV